MSATHNFGDKDTRNDDMDDAIDEWVQNLANAVETATETDEFKEYLDVLSRFHTYSPNNQRLINLQCPNASKVAGFNTWQNEFDRTVKKGESAIWIWAPMTAKKCPTCENSKKYHNIEDCDDDTDPENWTSGIVGFRPVPVFDVSQTEGEPLPELDTDAYGDAADLIPALLAAADTLDVPSVELTAPSDWTHGTAKGVSYKDDGRVDVKVRENNAATSKTLTHEYAHTLLHSGVDDEPEKEKREVEAESVAYVVSRHFGLDASGSAFYLAAWSGDNPDEITERLDRISKTAKKIITAIEDTLDTIADDTQPEKVAA